MNAAQRAVERIRDEMASRKLSQRDLAQRLRWSQGRIAKILKARVNLRVIDLERIADAVGIALSETVRLRGREWFAELTPVELAVLEQYRRRPPYEREAIALLFGIGVPPKEMAPKRPKIGRPKNSELRTAAHK